MLTCNLANKVFPAILSRCPLIPLDFDMKDLLKHVKWILDNEKVKYTTASLKQFVKESFRFHPDCRRIINYLQFCCNTGELVVKLNAIVNTEKAGLLQEVVNSAIESKNVLEARKIYLQSKSKLGDFVDAGSQLFNFVVDSGIVTDPEGVLKLTDLLYQLNCVVDKEPTFFGMLVAVQKYGRKVEHTV